SLSGLESLELLLGDSLVRSLRTRHLREYGHALQLSAEPDQGVHESRDGVLVRVDVCRVAHGVVSPETLVELLHPEHVVQSQIGSRLDNLLSRFLAVDLLDCLQKRVLGRNLNHRGARCVLARLNVVALRGVLKRLVPLIWIDVREADSANEEFRKDRVDSLRDTRQLGDGAGRSDRPGLHRDRNPKLVSEVLGSYLDDIRHLLQESSELIAVGSLRILDPSHSEERSNSEVSHADPSVPSKHIGLLRVIHVTVGGAHEEPSHQLVRTAHAVYVDLARVVDERRQVHVTEVAVFPGLEGNLTAGVRSDHWVWFPEVRVGRVPNPWLTVSEHALSNQLKNFNRVGLAEVNGAPE